MTEIGTALVKIRRAANLPETFADERIQAIRDFCVPTGVKITTSHLAMFLATAIRYDLDPMLGEIWLAEIEGKIVCVTGRNSWVKIASRQRDFGGIQSGVVFEKDDWSASVGPDGVWTVHHVIGGMHRGGIVGSYAQLFLKDKPPIFKHRLWDDFKHLHSKKNWIKNPKDMIEIRAVTAVFRQAFPMGGLFDPSESELENGDEAVLEAAHAQEKTLSEAERLRARLAGTENVPPVPLGSFELGDAFEDDLELDREIEEAESSP
jgi:hypothetical protein